MPMINLREGGYVAVPNNWRQTPQQQSKIVKACDIKCSGK